MDDAAGSKATKAATAWKRRKRKRKQTSIVQAD